MSMLRRNHVQLSGTGHRTVIFGHGFGTDQTAWRRVLPFFEQRFQVVRYDLTGLGLSDKSAYDRERHGTLHGHADDLLELCRELKVENAVYVGHSMGGMIGVLAAIREPKLFSKLALIAASPRYLNDGDYVGGLERDQLESVMSALASDYIAWCEATVPMAVGAPKEDEVTSDVLSTFKRVDPEIANHLARVIFYSDHREQLKDMNNDCLLLHAVHDAFVPEQVAQYLAKQLPRARLKMLPGRGGHYPHLGMPDEVIDALRVFFAS